MTVPPRVDFAFTMGDVFPAGDPIARYVMRLSIGLGDIRLVADQLMRDNLTDRERVYFGRLLMAHMREILLVLEPPPLSKRQTEAEAPEPLHVGDVIATLGEGNPDVVAKLKTLWANARVALKAHLELRPETTLWQELRRVRRSRPLPLRLYRRGRHGANGGARNRSLPPRGFTEMTSAKWSCKREVRRPRLGGRSAFPMSEAVVSQRPPAPGPRERRGGGTARAGHGGDRAAVFAPAQHRGGLLSDQARRREPAVRRRHDDYTPRRPNGRWVSVSQHRSRVAERSCFARGRALCQGWRLRAHPFYRHHPDLAQVCGQGAMRDGGRCRQVLRYFFYRCPGGLRLTS